MNDDNNGQIEEKPMPTRRKIDIVAVGTTCCVTHCQIEKTVNA